MMNRHRAVVTVTVTVAVTVVGLTTGERSALVGALLGMVGLRSFFWLLWAVRSAGMGFGDVRLAALVGRLLAAARPLYRRGEAGVAATTIRNLLNERAPLRR